MKILLLLILYLISGTSFGLTKIISVYLGQNITITCNYPVEYERNTKNVNKVDDNNKIERVLDTDTKFQNGRFSISDDRSAKVLTVNISDIRETDEAFYLFGVRNVQGSVRYYSYFREMWLHVTGCELEEKEKFWSELDEVMESIPTGERVVIGPDFNGHVGEGNTGDEVVMGKFGVKERNLEGQMVVDFVKRMDMGVVNTYFQKREEHRVTYKSGGRRTQVDCILCRRGNLKEISDCKVVVGESVARQRMPEPEHRMVVCRMTLMVCKTKRSKIEIEKKTKWWKLKKEECCEEFRQKLRQALGGQVVLPDDWETTAEVIRETGRKDSIQRKRLAKKKWDKDRTEENRQEYKELQRRVKREVSKAKQKAYDKLYTRLDTREGEKDLYRLARQRDRDGKDVQQVRVIKDKEGRVLTSEESVQRRWKEYFEELMNEENEREKRVEGVNSVEQKVDKIRKDEVRKALKRMKSGKAVGPDDIPVEVWKCLGEAAVEFLASLFNRVLEKVKEMLRHWKPKNVNDKSRGKRSKCLEILEWYMREGKRNREKEEAVTQALKRQEEEKREEGSKHQTGKEGNEPPPYHSRQNADKKRAGIYPSLS
ncbi:hypothetical protein QTP86_003825, partial [Hemibagrus guttatus]